MAGGAAKAEHCTHLGAAVVVALLERELWRGPTLLLAQAGEFAFVVIALARAGNLISLQVSTAAVAVAALSMMLTPLLALGGRALGKRFEPVDHAAPVPQGDGSEFEDHVVIGGFGRVGQTVAKMLEAENVPIIGTSPDSIARAEDRKRFRELVEKLGLLQPANDTATSFEIGRAHV